VTFRRKDKTVTDAAVSTGDVALLYISRWKTAQAAERFARFYAAAVSQRYRSATVQEVQACAGSNCPVSTAQIMTEEGPVIVERRQDNSVIVSESFDSATSAKLRAALRDKNDAIDAEYLPQEEIGLRLFANPAFVTFARQVGERIAEDMSRELPR
jgi:hypothetical protein